MISASDFLTLLEEKDLVPPEVIADLRKKIDEAANGPKPLTAPMVARFLVDRGYLSRLLAQRLLDKASQDSSSEERKRPEPLPLSGSDSRLDIPGPGSVGEEDIGDVPVEVVDEDEELGFADEPPEAESVEPSPETASSPAASDRQSMQTTAPPSASGGSVAGGYGVPPQAGIPGYQQPAPAAPQPGVPPTPGTIPSSMPGTGIPGALGGGMEPLQGPAPPVKKRRNVWESPLLLWGAGGVLLLLFAAIALVWILNRQGGDELLAAADDDYRSASYTQAIHKYDMFLERFPNHPEVGAARVRRGLAQLRQAVEGAPPDEALDLAQEVLPQIDDEEVFRAEAEGELTALLPKLSEKLAQRAYEKRDPDLVDAAEESLALLERYVPKEKRPQTRLADIQALLDGARREITKEDKRVEAIAEIKKLLESGKSDQAYDVRRRLLKQYPSLASDKELQSVIAQVTESEGKRVTFSDEPVGAPVRHNVEKQPDQAALAAVVQQGEAAVPEGTRLFVAVSGSLFALDATDGSLRWTHRVGAKVAVNAAPLLPVSLGNKPGDDVLVVDWNAEAVERLSSADGTVRWHKPIGEAVDSMPVVNGDDILVATRSGRIIVLDAEAGESRGAWRLPQELTLAPVVDSRRRRWYQVAAHSNLFVIEPEAQACRQVVYLGHEAGTIRVPPLFIDPYLLLFEETGEKTRLRVFNVENADDDTVPVIEVQQLTIDGLIRSPAIVFGSRVLAVTIDGDLLVYELRGGEPDEPVTFLASGKRQELARREGPGIHYATYAEGNVYLADSQLTKYEFQASARRLLPKWIAVERTAALGPPVVLGNTVFYSARETRQPGVVVAAVDTESGEVRWKVRIAIPAEPSVDAQRESNANVPYFVSRSGDVFRLSGEPKDGVLLSAMHVGLPKESGPLRRLIRVNDKEWLAYPAEMEDHVWKIQTSDDATASQATAVRFPEPVTAPAAFVNGQFITASEGGHVYAVNWESGKGEYHPLQLPAAPRERFTWVDAVGTAEGEALLADREHGMYRVRLRDAPTRHVALEAAVEADVTDCGIVILGDIVLTVDSRHTIHAHRLPDLESVGELELEGRCAWGPIAVGEYAFLATDDSRLCVIDASPKICGRIELQGDRPVGRPWPLGKDVLLATRRGLVLRVDPAQGKILDRSELRVPLATGPVDIQGTIVVGTTDGHLVFLDAEPLLSLNEPSKALQFRHEP
ncbi:PQQ-binding-like beta-propeller repeat protein [Thermostilla marina]